MKRSIYIILLIALLFTSCSSQNIFKENMKVQASVIPYRVTFNGALTDMTTIAYGSDIYVPLHDICHYLEFSYESQKNYIIDIDTAKGISAPGKSNQIENGKTITVFKNPYHIRLEGIDTYIDSMYYDNMVYVPLMPFCELINKKFQLKETGADIVIDDIPAKPVASVNGEIITDLYFSYHYKILYKDNIDIDNLNPQEVEKFKSDVLELLIDRKLMLQNARKEKFTVLNKDDSEKINAKIADILENSKSFKGIEAFKRVLVNYEVNFGDFMTDMKETYIIDKYKAFLLKDIKPDTTAKNNFIQESITKWRNESDIEIYQ